MYFVILVFVLFIDDCCGWGWWLRGFAEVAFGFDLVFLILVCLLFGFGVWMLGWFLLICCFGWNGCLIVVYWCLRWMCLAGFGWLVGFWVVSLCLCLICLLIFGFYCFAG